MTLISCALGVNAQNTKVITGAVIDKNGNPLPNALVEATGGAENVTTEADGSFRIEVPIWLKSLTAKYAGFQGKKIKIKNKSQLIFEMKHKPGSWFLDAAYSIDFATITYSRAGLMGGYLGNWGGYTRVLMPFGDHVVDCTPSLTIGAIKQVSKPVYLYLGAGYTSTSLEEYSDYDDYWYEYEDVGGMIETGAIFKFNKVNFSVGYAYIICDGDNHSVQLSVGYCF